MCSQLFHQLYLVNIAQALTNCKVVHQTMTHHKETSVLFLMRTWVPTLVPNMINYIFSAQMHISNQKLLPLHQETKSFALSVLRWKWVAFWWLSIFDPANFTLDYRSRWFLVAITLVDFFSPITWHVHRLDWLAWTLGMY